MDRQLEQFYQLLSDYGLTGKTQPLNRQQKADDEEANQIFPD